MTVSKQESERRRKGAIRAMQDNYCGKCKTTIRCNLGAFRSHMKWCGRNFEEAFWQRINKDTPSGCWEWTGATQFGGYGLVTLPDRRNTVAHRLAWQYVNGPIEGGLFVLHRCDNKLCVNPAHLFLGDHQANCDDKWAKGRGFAKLNDAAVREIRASPLTSKKLAAKFGVNYSAIWNVRTGRKWRHVK